MLKALIQLFIKQNGRNPNAVELLKLKFKAANQSGKGKVIEFPKDKITPFNKPRPGEGIAGIEQRAKKIEALNEKLKKFTVKPDFYETMFGKSPKKPTVVKDKTLLKDSPEAIAKMKADNKAAIKRLKDKKKTVEDFSEDGDFDPGGMASGGLAREGYGKGKIVKWLSSFGKKPKKVEVVGDSGIKKFDVEKSRKEAGLDAESLKKDEEAFKLRLQEILAKHSTKHAEGGLARVGMFAGGIPKGLMALLKGIQKKFGKKALYKGDEVVIDNKIFKRSDKKRPPTEEELDDKYAELWSDETSPSDFGSTIDELDSALAEQHAYEADMFAEYKSIGGSKRAGGPKDPMADAIENASPGYTGDLKYDAQMLADDVAEQRFGKEFDDLSQTQQSDLYSESYKALSGQRANYIKNKNLSKPTKTLEGIKKEGTIDISDPEVADEFTKFMKESDPKGYKDLEQKIEIGGFDVTGRKKNASGGIAGQLHLNEGGRASFTKGGKVSSGLANILGV